VLHIDRSVEKWLLGRPDCKWEDSIQSDFSEVLGCGLNKTSYKKTGNAHVTSH